MIKDIQTASFFLKDGLNDNSSFHWCFCPGDDGGPSGDEGAGEGGYGGVADADIGSGVDASLSVDEAKNLCHMVTALTKNDPSFCNKISNDNSSQSIVDCKSKLK